jgi:hypothetical protein
LLIFSQGIIKTMISFERHKPLDKLNARKVLSSHHSNRILWSKVKWWRGRTRNENLLKRRITNV